MTNDNMKFKPLSKSQIIISIDRLTRFKPTEEKYLRVFSDIILSNLIEPRLKKSDISDMNYSEIRDYAVEIFNSSLPELSNDYKINLWLKDYENKVFKNNTEVQKLLNNHIDYKSALRLVDKDSDVLNLKFLEALNKSATGSVKTKRKTEGFLYPIEKVVISEGITEEILLPVFGRLCGYDFNKNGVKIIAAGGKNQVVKLYYRLSEETKLPIFILLDNDAQENKRLINTRLRKTDKIHLLKNGEFEDILSKELIIKTINSEFKNFVSITQSDLETELSMVKTLETIFKTKCLHEFKKADFAQHIKQHLNRVKYVTDEISNIIDEIKLIK